MTRAWICAIRSALWTTTWRPCAGAYGHRPRPPNRVSDTTAITNLAAVGRLDLMESIFRHVLIPEAVYQELTAHGDGVPGAREVRSSL